MLLWRLKPQTCVGMFPLEIVLLIFSQKKDRLRQEQLARERIAARRKKKANELEKELREKEQEQLDDIGDKENLVALQVQNDIVKTNL